MVCRTPDAGVPKATSSSDGNSSNGSWQNGAHGYNRGQLHAVLDWAEREPRLAKNTGMAALRLSLGNYGKKGSKGASHGLKAVILQHVFNS